jgi:hypothetical protein
MAELQRSGWKVEELLAITPLKRLGKLDAVLYSGRGPVAVEWETGNISSSHRALNKMALGLLNGTIAAGVLIVPSRKLYRYLTDRIEHDRWRSGCESRTLGSLGNLACEIDLHPDPGPSSRVGSRAGPST